MGETHREEMERKEKFNADFWREVNCGYCEKGCDIPLRAAVVHITRLESTLAELRAALASRSNRIRYAAGERCSD